MIHTILEWKKNSTELVEDNTEATLPVESLYLSDPTALDNSSEVIKISESDFENTPKEENKPAGSHSQPLLGLVLTPTRELAVQVKHHIDAISKFTGESLQFINRLYYTKYIPKFQETKKNDTTVQTSKRLSWWVECHRRNKERC